MEERLTEQSGRVRKMQASTRHLSVVCSLRDVSDSYRGRGERHPALPGGKVPGLQVLSPPPASLGAKYHPDEMHWLWGTHFGALCWVAGLLAC